MVIWKYVLPDDQLEMRVNGCVTNNSYSFIFHRYISIKVIYYEYETEFHYPSHCSYQSKFFEILSDYLGAFFFWFVGHLNEKCVGILRYYNESLFFGNSQLNLLVQFFLLQANIPSFVGGSDRRRSCWWRWAAAQGNWARSFVSLQRRPTQRSANCRLSLGNWSSRSLHSSLW